MLAVLSRFRRLLHVPLINNRQPGWKLSAAICLLVAPAGAFGLDWLIRAQAGPRSTEPQANHAHAMLAMITARGITGTTGGPVNMAAVMSFGWEKGMAAPDFSLPAVRADRRVSLGGLRGKPAILVFASLTCVIFHEHIGEIERLYQVYNDRAAWIFVNVTEARHTIQGLEFLLGDGDLMALPVPLPERRRNIARGLDVVGLTMPAVIDISRAAEAAYDAFPLRLVVVDAEGKIAIELGRGAPPGKGWDLSVLERWLKEQPVARKDQ